MADRTMGRHSACLQRDANSSHTRYTRAHSPKGKTCSGRRAVPSLIWLLEQEELSSSTAERGPLYGHFGDQHHPLQLHSCSCSVTGSWTLSPPPQKCVPRPRDTCRRMSGSRLQTTRMSVWGGMDPSSEGNLPGNNVNGFCFLQDCC